MGRVVVESSHSAGVSADREVGEFVFLRYNPRYGVEVLEFSWRHMDANQFRRVRIFTDLVGMCPIDLARTPYGQSLYKVFGRFCGAQQNQHFVLPEE